VALLTTQWNNKSDQLSIIVEALPNITTIPGMEGGFNANEIAGAMSWLLPVVAALAAYRWRDRLPRVGVTAAFFVLFAALFIGQSRMAVIGILIALALVVRLVIPAGKWRNLGLLALIGVGILEVLIINNVFDIGNRQRMRARDESSFSDRVDIWRSGIAVLKDYPLTGAGMNMFRYNPIRQLYPVAKYKNRILPHAHNEWVQIASDLGIPGLLVFAGWYIVAGYMLLAAYRRGEAEVRALAVGVAAGLLAHAVFGMGDAIPLWDRFAFVFWWMLALAGAAYVVSQKNFTSDHTGRLL
jgi:O-antigen ligase